MKNILLTFMLSIAFISFTANAGTNGRILHSVKTIEKETRLAINNPTGHIQNDYYQKFTIIGRNNQTPGPGGTDNVIYIYLSQSNSSNQAMLDVLKDCEKKLMIVQNDSERYDFVISVQDMDGSGDPANTGSGGGNFYIYLGGDSVPDDYRIQCTLMKN